MEEKITQFVEKNKLEFSQLIIGLFFVCFFLYLFYGQINIVPLKSISPTQQLLVVTVASYVIAKIFFLLGSLSLDLVEFALFQHNRKAFILKWWNECFKHLSSGPKGVEDDVVFSRMEFLKYFEENKIANEKYTSLINQLFFWTTFHGGNLIILFACWFFGVSLTFPVTFAIASLIAAVMSDKERSSFYHEVAVMLKRNKETRI